MAGIIWIASYPKSGNTWVRLFLAALASGRDVDLARMEGASSIASSRSLIEHHVDLTIADLARDEVADLRPATYRAIARTARETLFLKAHDCFGRTPAGEALFPPEATRGVIHLVRDPRDVCLSLAPHVGVSTDRAIALMGREAHTTGKATRMQVAEVWGSWSDHARSWMEAEVPRLTLRYEDMVADPLAQLGSIAAFCGLAADDAAIEAAVRATDFAQLAAKEAESGFRERPKGMARFFRSGRAGQWREALDGDQIRRIEDEHGAMMQRLGYLPALDPRGEMH